MEKDVITLNQKAWNRLADRYAYSGYGEITPTFKYFYTRLTPNCRILDIGSGTGIPFAKFLVEKGFRILGIDISSRMVQIASRNVPSGEFRELSMTEMTFKEEFGGVVASYSMLLLNPPLFHDVAKRIVYSLQEGGILYLSLNESSENDEHSDLEAIVTIMGEKMYSRGYTELEVRNAFIPLGFRVLKIKRSIRTTPEFGVENMMEVVFEKNYSNM